MSAPTLSEFRQFMREMHDAELDPVLQSALDAATDRVESFIGYSLDEYEADVPPVIRMAIMSLAMLETDNLDSDKEQQIEARVERALRPYRRETGVRAA